MSLKRACRAPSWRRVSTSSARWPARARADLVHLDFAMARRTDLDGARALAGQRAVEVLTRRHDGALLALFSDKWRLAQVQREHPDILLEPLIAG